MGRGAFTNLTAEEFMDRTWVASKLGFMPHAIYYVDSTSGSTNYTGLLRSSAKATLAQALALVSDGSGDCIIMLPGHAETLSTTTQGVSIGTGHDGVSIIGCGNARNRPTLTCGAADISGVALAGANCRISNVRFVGSTSQTTTTSVIMAITGADNIIEDCVFEHGGAGPLGCISLAAAHRTVLRNLTFLGTSAGPDFAIKTSGSAAPSNDCVIDGLLLQYMQSAGLDSAAIVCTNTTGIPGWSINNVRLVGGDVAVLDINGSSIATTVDSLATNCYGAMRLATTGDTIFDVGSTFVVNSFWTDAVASPSPYLGVAFPATATVTNYRGVIAGSTVATTAGAR